MCCALSAVGIVWALLLVAGPRVTHAAHVRIKDITTVEGVRVNTLIGMGLVTGLNGTGGTSPVTREYAMNMLQRFGLRADPAIRRAIRTDTKQRTNNLSVVTVTAELPIFAKPGSRIDVTVAAFDDATSLQGGILITTPLVGVDDTVYATASGPISVGGFSFSGDAATVQQNHPTTGRAPNAGIVEMEVPNHFAEQGNYRLLLQTADFKTAGRVSDAINAVFPNSALAVDAGTIQVLLPESFLNDPACFIGEVENLQVVPDVKARVVINERTGTVIVGEHVKISRVAITHANLSVITSETPTVSQPAPFSEGETTVVPRTQVDVTEGSRPVSVVDEPVTVGDLAQALNALGVTPRDLSSIFQQLKATGALHAELVFQ